MTECARKLFIKSFDYIDFNTFETYVRLDELFRLKTSETVKVPVVIAVDYFQQAIVYNFVENAVNLREVLVKGIASRNWDEVSQLINEMMACAEAIYRSGALHGDLVVHNLLKGPDGLVVIDNFPPALTPRPADGCVVEDELVGLITSLYTSLAFAELIATFGPVSRLVRKATSTKLSRTQALVFSYRSIKRYQKFKTLAVDGGARSVKLAFVFLSTLISVWK